MDLLMTQYIEVNTIGIVMLLAMLFYIIGTHQEYDAKGQKYFIKLLICNIALLFSDILIYLMRGHNSPILIILNNIVCVIYFLLHSYFGYSWFQYSVIKLFPEYKLTKKIKLISVLPCLISSIFVLISPITKWVYFVTQENRYMRGSFIWIPVFISYLYWIISAILVIYERFNPRMIREDEVYKTLLIFPIPTLIGNLFQLKFYGLSIVWVCSAISLLILFINLQNYQISRDILTGLFNRRQTNKQILWEINHLSDAQYLLFAVMIDVDKFKIINDEFGHLAGDKALINIAEIIKKSCRERDFVGRFGGDEFIIIGHTKDKSEVENIIKNISKIVDEYNEKFNFPYKLSLTCGYEVFSKKNILSIDDVISSADNEMYKMKNK